MSLRDIGVIAWGTITAILAAGALGIVVYGGINTIPSSVPSYDPDASKWALGLYVAIKDCGNVVAGILGFSGLAWSHFYNASIGTQNG